MSDKVKLRALRVELERIIESCGRSAQRLEPRIRRCHPDLAASAKNLAHYLGLRTLDLRRLQDELGHLGLSSLGRCEGHVLETLLQVATRLREALDAAEPSSSPADTMTEAARGSIGFDEADALLHRHAQELLGAHPSGRHVLVMVTSPPAREVTEEWACELLRAGMNCLRVNCSAGDASDWNHIASTLRRASGATALPCRLLFDLPGPKIRTRALRPGPEVLHVRRNKDELGRTTSPSRVKLAVAGPEALPVSAQWRQRLAVGDFVCFVDTAGRRRRLRITEKAAEHLTAECNKSFYITSSTMLHFLRDGKELGKSPCGAIAPQPFSIALSVDDVVTLREGDGHDPRDTEPAFGLSVPGLIESVELHHRVIFDDGRLAGVVVAKAPSRLKVQIVRAQAARVRLKENKGVSFPDSSLPVHFITEQDRAALDAVIDLADLLAFSFVRSAAEVQDAIALVNKRRPELGIVVKLETQQGFAHLPDILFELMTHAPVGLMIARGDLAVECGFERMAELQEEILWLCEACHMPVIWATQVLESLAQAGIPTRAEITDAAMAMRAECVMLNRGPHVLSAVGALVDIIVKMERHQYKKRQLYRPLRVAGGMTGEGALW